MMGWLRLIAAEAVAVVLEDGADDFQVHSEWAIVGKVLSPSTLHINTIALALRPAWGNLRGLVINSGGDNVFVAEFASKADKDRVVDGPPWVVGKHAVLLRDFDVDQRPKDMVFNRLKIWARILDLPFGYMYKKWGEMIVGPLCCEGSVPSVNCDATGRCWGSYMRARIEVDVDQPLRRGVTVFSQGCNATEWYEVQYENLPLYCFSCGIIGHSSTDCKNPVERDGNGKLPYSVDRLCAPDDRKKKNQGQKSLSGSVSTEQGCFSQERTSQSFSKSGAAGQKQKPHEVAKVSSPVKDTGPRAHANRTNAGKGTAKKKGTSQEGMGLTGQKHKKQQVYRVRETPVIEDTPNQTALVLFQGPSAQVDEGHAPEDLSNDSNKKLRKICVSGSADQAGAVEQPRQMQ
ncbi:hypothetical protein ACQ4PT_036828 [Festuca glaucescens]